MAETHRLEPHVLSTLDGASMQQGSLTDFTPAECTLVIENMHCGGCMRGVEAALRDLPGVGSSRANLSAKRVTAVFDPAHVDVDKMIAALADAGFKAGELAGHGAGDAAARDKEFLRRLGVAGFAAMNVMLLSVSVWAGSAGDMSAPIQSLFHWLSALIALPAIAYAGQPFFRSAAAALKAGRLNMDVPISLGVLLAAGMSLFQTIRGSEQVYFDAAITLLFFLLIGRYLDQRMRAKAQGAAQNLIGLMSMSATVIGDDGETRRLPARALSPGMKILVSAGDRIPVDAIVLDGTGDVDESLITGESRPRTVVPGDQVYAGTLNLQAPITLKATATDSGTLLAEISRLMEAASQAKGRYVQLADRAAAFYAPAVHGLALATFIGWLLMGTPWQDALTSAIAVLIITCPCALALAVPAVQIAASSRLFDGGVILKTPGALERLAEADTIVFDKTGTLSLGTPALNIESSFDPETMTSAASLAVTSRHPYARALVAAAKSRGIEVTPAADVDEVPGAGLVRRAHDGSEERLGSAAFVGAGSVNGAGEVSLWYRKSGRDPVAFQFEDALRADASDVVARLKSAAYHVELLSGDRRVAVAAAADAAGIEVWHGGQKPGDKIARLDALKKAGRKVIMIGDGLNDAPALAAGHASLSPSSAAEISQNASDVVFQGDRLSPIIETLALARAAKRLALQNFALAAGYNALFVPLAVAGIVTPLIAAIAMSASSIAVTANALRLRVKRLEL